jgi:hypothetical protein
MWRVQDGGSFRAELRIDCRRGTGSPNDGTRFKSAHKAGDLGIPMTLLSGGASIPIKGPNGVIRRNG